MPARKKRDPEYAYSLWSTDYISTDISGIELSSWWSVVNIEKHREMEIIILKSQMVMLQDDFSMFMHF